MGALLLRRGMFVGLGASGGCGRRGCWIGCAGLIPKAGWGRSGLVLAGLVVAVGVEDAFLWGGGRCPVRYRRLVAESGYSRSTVARLMPAVLAVVG